MSIIYYECLYSQNRFQWFHVQTFIPLIIIKTLAKSVNLLFIHINYLHSRPSTHTLRRMNFLHRDPPRWRNSKSSWEQHHLSVLFSIVKEEYIRRSSSLNDNVLFSKLFEMSYCVNRREGWNFDVFIYFRFFVHTTYFQKTILRFHHIVHNFFEFCFNVLLFSK